MELTSKTECKCHDVMASPRKAETAQSKPIAYRLPKHHLGAAPSAVNHRFDDFFRFSLLFRPFHSTRRQPESEMKHLKFISVLARHANVARRVPECLMCVHPPGGCGVWCLFWLFCRLVADGALEDESQHLWLNDTLAG